MHVLTRYIVLFAAMFALGALLFGIKKGLMLSTISIALTVLVRLIFPDQKSDGKTKE